MTEKIEDKREEAKKKDLAFEVHNGYHQKCKNEVSLWRIDFIQEVSGYRRRERTITHDPFSKGLCKVKLLRAQGECLGTDSRRRTR